MTDSDLSKQIAMRQRAIARFEAKRPTRPSTTFPSGCTTWDATGESANRGGGLLNHDAGHESSVPSKDDGALPHVVAEWRAVTPSRHPGIGAGRRPKPRILLTRRLRRVQMIREKNVFPLSGRSRKP
jgi:hypothetical protein